MIDLIENVVIRRLVTVPVVIVLFVLTSALLPILLVLAMVVDAIRALTKARPAMAIRMVTFTWIYLLGEIWALLALGAVALLGHRRSVAATYRLQTAWAAWNYHALRAVFSLRFREDGGSSCEPPPLLLLARHASLIDSLLPAVFVTAKHGVPLRYVLKKELLWDPALDIAGNRLPNHFVDRTPSELDEELTAIADLGTTAGEDDGVVIFPEGTRFSDGKLKRAIERSRNRTGRIADMTRAYRAVLPPRPAGTLTLLDTVPGDVVVLAHTGLEGFARPVDIWDGGLVGREVRIQFWRIPRSEIPLDRSGRIEWLFGIWADVDLWIRDVSSRQPGD